MILKRQKILIIFISLFAFGNADYVAKTPYGTYVGQEKFEYIAFEGIRYAQPPLGNLRFQPPQYPRKTAQTFILNETRPVSAQFNPFINAIEGEEDCLFLNIYQPKNIQKSKELLPVVMHFHGGGWTYGSSRMYAEELLMNKTQKFITVFFNYRLGILGFLSSGDSFIPGNMGLKDQAMALRWVKENIAAFGGDPENICITGFSSGSAAVQLMYLSPLTKGLFARSIAHSGSILASWPYTRNAKQLYQELLSKVNCTRSTNAEIMTCLRAIPALVFAQTLGSFSKILFTPVTVFGFVVEPPSRHAFLTEEPLTLIQRGNLAKVPMLVSVTDQEGGLFGGALASNPPATEQLENDPQYVAQYLYDFYFLPNKETITTDLLNTIDSDDNTLLDKVTEFTTNRYFKVPLVNLILSFSQWIPMYMYQFNFKSVWGWSEVFSGGQYSAVSHAEDLEYIYNLITRIGHPFTQEEDQMSDLLISLYESYIKNDDEPKLGPYALPNEIFDRNKKIRYLAVDSPTDIMCKATNYKNYGNFEYFNSLFKGDPFLS